MNQILITNDEKEAKSVEIKPVIRFFAIVAIVFAIILICEGAFNLYNNNANKNTDFIKAELLSKEVNGSTINVRIKDEVGINTLSYKWDDGIEAQVKANGSKDKTFEIEIPQGEHNLKLTVLDVDGHKTSFEDIKVAFTEDVDSKKPVITIAAAENAKGKIEITVTDETELDYFTYQWENGDEVKVRPDGEDNKTAKQILDVEKGTNNLIVYAVDKAGNEEAKNKKIIGSNGPTISVTADSDNFIVKVTDEVIITKIEYTLNDETHTVEGIPQGAKEFEFKVPLQQGVNKLKINAYEDHIMTEYKCKKTK